MSLELFDEPTGVVNADIQAIIRCTQKGSRQVAEFVCRRARQPSQLAAPTSVNQTILQINADIRVSPLKQPLHLTEKSRIHNEMIGCA